MAEQLIDDKYDWHGCGSKSICVITLPISFSKQLQPCFFTSSLAQIVDYSNLGCLISQVYLQACKIIEIINRPTMFYKLCLNQFNR